MKVITDIHNFTPQPCAATVGSFDGVHLGHKSMLGELRSRALERGLPVMAVTFARHPRMLFGSGTTPFLLSSNDEKAAMLEASGVDICVMLDFDKDMAAMSAERFMNEVLSASLGVRMLCVGYDHHFGKPREGEGFEQYVRYGASAGVEVFRANPFFVGDNAVSSSKVRRALACGDVEAAERMLGRSYSFAGKVVHGAGIGRGMGFPTANVSLSDGMKMLPADGVYAVRATCCGNSYDGVMNIGVKPTIGDGLLRTVEVHMLDFAGDIYGKDIVVEVKRFLRGEAAFDGIEALRRQIEADINEVKRFSGL
ncbi:MAG: riboflavin biosynthesis protein RibF [Bacteroidaceae bacterium]|nr:riboflavin biosynthesis protein RibF [Bacteroidaceae bacterium]